MQFHGFAQIDQKKLDSLAKAIDSSAKAYKQWQNRFTKQQDSIYRSTIKIDVDQHNRNLQQYLSEHKRREKKVQQQAYIRIGISVLLFIVLAMILFAGRKPKT